MKIIFLLFVTSMALSCFAQTPSLDWVKGIGGNSGAHGVAIATDINGNVFVLGAFSGTVDFSTSTGQVLTSNGGYWDTFLLKSDSQGNLIWVNQIGSPSADYPSNSALVLDELGDVYITGALIGTTNFIHQAGSFNVVASGAPSGATDLFVQKVDNDGTVVWTKVIGQSGGSCYGRSISIDDNNNLYIGGPFQGEIDFDTGPGSSTLNTFSNDNNLFVLKLDYTGDFVWVKEVVLNDAAFINDIEVDGNNEVYIVGQYKGTAVFNPGLGASSINSNGDYDLFIQKLSETGDLIWVKSLGGLNQDIAYGVQFDSGNNPIIVGNFKETVDFDPSLATYDITSNGGFDCFILKLTENGDFEWTKHFGSIGDQYLVSVDVDDNDGVYLSGYFVGNVDFDTGAGMQMQSSTGATDVYLLKLDNSADYQWVYTFGAGGYDKAYSVDIDISGNIFLTGNYSNSISFTTNSGVVNLNANGYEDVYIQKFGQCLNTNLTEDYQTACESYTWIDGNTYTSSNNTATYTLTNIYGCDSIVTLNLSIHSNSSIDVQSSCGSYTWIDGITYTSSNNSATHILTNSFGCDSIITLNLTINNVDVGTSINDITITSNTANGQYQWLDCDNNYEVLLGETSQSFTPDYNSSFAVEVLENGCTDTSECVLINIVGISENEGIQISVFPNPATNIINISSEVEIESITLLDITGKTIKTIHNESKLTVGDVTSGIYWVKVSTVSDKVSMQKIVINH